MIKVWWENLSDHDRKVVSIGGIVAGILFIYILIWSPLSHAVSNEKKSIQSSQSLLTYLQQSAVKIQAFQAGGVSATMQTPGALLTTVETTLASQQLSSFLNQVQQPQDNQAELTFEKVPFDKLMQWLQTLWTTSGVSVVAFSANPQPMIGTADVTMTLKSSSSKSYNLKE